MRNAVTHGRNAACNLRHTTGFAGGFLQAARIIFQRLMGREHVVIGGNDADIRRIAIFQFFLVAGAASGKAVGEIGAAQMTPARAIVCCIANMFEIARAGFRRAHNDAISDGGYFRTDSHDVPLCGPIDFNRGLGLAQNGAHRQFGNGALRQGAFINRALGFAIKG